jgi:hypothetical protein
MRFSGVSSRGAKNVAARNITASASAHHRSWRPETAGQSAMRQKKPTKTKPKVRSELPTTAGREAVRSEVSMAGNDVAMNDVPPWRLFELAEGGSQPLP